MCELLLKGEGHTPAATSKDKQVDRGETGCRYADTQLIPALKKTRRFVDQEFIT